MKRLLISLALLACAAQAASWVRYNQAGYTPDRGKSAIVMSDENMQGQAWSLKSGGTVVKSGTFGASNVGVDLHTPKAYNFEVDFSSVTEPGSYTLEATAFAPVNVRISADPYSGLITQTLRALRVARSGSEGLLLHGPSHLGDSAAAVKIPNSLANGSWKSPTVARKVNMLGGHYDAGDYIKFTLTEAFVAYQLLRAYQVRPQVFTKVNSQTDLPDVLDEANYSLQYLARTFPNDSTFIIEVGDSQDHNQGDRLPENDALDGRRPALSALSRVHMGVTAAALALGSRVLGAQGKTTEAQAYRDKAIAIYARARATGSVATAFLRDPTNDFYKVDSDIASMELGAAELYTLTQDAQYLTAAQSYPAAGDCGEVGWACWDFFANFALAPYDDAAAARAATETQGYEDIANFHPWALPGVDYYWAVYHCWVAEGNAALLTSLPYAFHGTLDYTFGRNPWGVSFLMSQDLPNSLQNAYSQIYPLTHSFPIGVLSEGPGDVTTHDQMAADFTPLASDPLAQFNTSVAVFSDNGSDFMLQEATIAGQSSMVLMLALATDSSLATPTLQRAPRATGAFTVHRQGDLFAVTGTHGQRLLVADLRGRVVADLAAQADGILAWDASSAPVGTYLMRVGAEAQLVVK